MFNTKLTFLFIMLIVLFALLGVVKHYYSNYHTALDKQRELTQLAQIRLDTINTLHAQDMKNRTLIAEQIANEQKLRATATITERRYRNAIENDTCATVNAPVDVVNLLRGTSTTTAHTTTAP